MRVPHSVLHIRLHLNQSEELSVERLEDFMEEDILWERQENGLSERQRQGEEEEKRVTETAFLVTRTNKQTLALVMVGLTILRVIRNYTQP